MKNNNLIKLAAGTCLMFGAAAASAQTAAPAAVAPAASAATAQAAPSPPMSKTDQRKANRLLSKRVRQALVKVKGLDSSAIVVGAKADVILLGGSVPEAGQIPLAVTAAQAVDGVAQVDNHLIVKPIGQ